tara:strand:+ start:962 stop:1708 length:747 start_codon:yes stop_codon:yes gene_type:complete
MKLLIYHIVNFFSHNLEKDIRKMLPGSKKLIIFDVGCYRGVFVKKMISFFDKNKIKFYLFDINKNVKNYISKLKKIKNISYQYNEVAVGNKNGKAVYNYNGFFEASGSSISTLYKKDKMWNLSRKIILKILFQETNEYKKYTVPTTTLDTFIKKRKIKLIDILKIDVDGFEYNSLKGAIKSFKKNKIKIILLEINENIDIFSNKEKKIINFLKKYKFELIKKQMAFPSTVFSKIKAGDYLFAHNHHIK